MPQDTLSLTVKTHEQLREMMPFLASAACDRVQQLEIMACDWEVMMNALALAAGPMGMNRPRNSLRTLALKCDFNNMHGKVQTAAMSDLLRLVTRHTHLSSLTLHFGYPAWEEDLPRIDFSPLAELPRLADFAYIDMDAEIVLPALPAIANLAVNVNAVHAPWADIAPQRLFLMTSGDRSLVPDDRPFPISRATQEIVCGCDETVLKFTRIGDSDDWHAVGEPPFDEFADEALYEALRHNIVSADLVLVGDSRLEPTSLPRLREVTVHGGALQPLSNVSVKQGGADMSTWCDEYWPFVCHGHYSHLFC